MVAFPHDDDKGSLADAESILRVSIFKILICFKIFMLNMCKIFKTKKE